MADGNLEGDGSTIMGELRRFARTSGAVGGIAARVAGARVFGIKTDRAAHAEDLKQILGGLKGPLMKVAQFLSTVPDALPAEYAEELAQLQSNAPAMGWPFVRRRMASELGRDWEARFARFSHEATAAASLGQVHRATLPDGTDVACKLQYPDMASTMEADLRQLKLAMAVYRRMDTAIQQDDIYTELRERLREELDYTREAAQMRLYGLMLHGVAGATVPPAVRSQASTTASVPPPPARAATDRRTALIVPSPASATRPAAPCPRASHVYSRKSRASDSRCGRHDQAPPPTPCRSRRPGAPGGPSTRSAPPEGSG